MTPAQIHVTEEFLAVRSKLKALAVKLTRDTDRAEDLLQDTYLRVVDKAEFYKPGTVFIAWATIVMRNWYISQGRLLKNQTHAGLLDEDMPTLPATQDARLILREAIWALRKIIPQHRAMLLMVGLEGMTYDGVAKRMECAEGTIKSGVSRARSQLRAVR